MPSSRDEANEAPFGHASRLLRQARPDGHDRPGQVVGEPGQEKGDAEDRHQEQRGEPTVIIGLSDPSPADGCERGNCCESYRHPDQNWQTGEGEGLVRACKTEGPGAPSFRANYRLRMSITVASEQHMLVWNR